MMMSRDQVITAFIAALLREGVDPGQIVEAVGRVRRIRLGQSIVGDADPLARAFAYEQAGRLR